MQLPSWLQQPCAQVVLLHGTGSHIPLLQAEYWLQATQALPRFPHFPSDWLATGTQVSPSQQPVGQLPALQGAQIPSAQPSLELGQATQNAPAVPHWPLDCEAQAMHVSRSRSQHPYAQK
jgi:hypothetical protein